MKFGLQVISYNRSRQTVINCQHPYRQWTLVKLNSKWIKILSTSWNFGGGGVDVWNLNIPSIDTFLSTANCSLPPPSRSTRKFSVLNFVGCLHSSLPNCWRTLWKWFLRLRGRFTRNNFTEELFLYFQRYNGYSAHGIINYILFEK